MRKVIGIGETVLDIIFKGDQPLKAVPGGSAYNALISLGTAGVKAMFIGETGNDRVGEAVRQHMTDHGVDTSCVSVFPDSKSPISLAFLDESNNASYLFYKDHPHDKLDFQFPDIQRDDVVIFGSFFAINPVVRPQVKGFLEYARSRGAILYYDVNYRASHKQELMKVTPNILENFELSDIVRGSDEDFEVMYGKRDADSVYRAEISFYTKKFIYTQRNRPVELRAENGMCKQYPVETASTVSTIGAGDNFNAGFIYGLLKYGITRQQMDGALSEDNWDRLMACANQFAENVCKSISNSIDAEFGQRMRLNLTASGE